MTSLQPFVPTTRAPWNFERAAHLARRAGFGGTRAEIDELVELGPAAAVSRLVDHPERDEELEREIRSHGGALGALEADATDARLVARERLVWIFRLARTRYPLREKLALVWHDHFATAESKVLRQVLIGPQIELFRREGAGPFRALLGKLARDPAMLVYLDNRTSKKDRPNENWARELMELFTLGVGHYTQRDVHEVARVFTGWSTPERSTPLFVFHAADHDTGDKEVLGREIRGRAGDAGIEEGEDVLDLLAAHPACARHIARKICVRFATHEPPDELVDAVAGELAASDLSIRGALRALFSSEAFYSPGLFFALYKNPLEHAVSALRALEVQNVHLLDLPDRLTRMGLRLFEPPSVAGWPPGRAWIQSSYLIERSGLALALSELPHTTRRVAGSAALDLDQFSSSASEHSGTAGDPGAEIDDLALRLLQRPLRAEHRALLLSYAANGGAEGGARPGPGRSRRDTLRGLIQLLLSTPEFALA